MQPAWHWRAAQLSQQITASETVPRNSMTPSRVLWRTSPPSLMCKQLPVGTIEDVPAAMLPFPEPNTATLEACWEPAGVEAGGSRGLHTRQAPGKARHPTRPGFPQPRLAACDPAV